MTPNVPMSETGTATLGIGVARTLRRNAKTTRMTSAIEIASVQLHVAHRGADRRRAIQRDRERASPAAATPAAAAAAPERDRPCR